MKIQIFAFTATWIYILFFPITENCLICKMQKRLKPLIACVITFIPNKVIAI